jgi:hypothetical protein
VEITMTAKQVFHPVATVVSALAGRIVASADRRRFERLTTHFPTHLLNDVGFDRDWDGSVYRFQDRA